MQLSQEISHNQKKDLSYFIRSRKKSKSLIVEPAVPIVLEKKAIVSML